MISIIPAVLAVFILALGIREIQQAMPLSRDNLEDSAQQPPLKKLGKSFYLFLVVIILFTLGNSSDAFIILRGQERGLNVIQVMLMLLAFNAVYIILSGPAGSLSDRIGRRKLLLAGWFIYGIVYLGFALANTDWQVWLLYSCYGLYYAATEGVAKALVADLVPSDVRGTAYGLYNAAIGLTALPASLIAGVLWQGLGGWTGFGPSASFFFGAGLALLAGIFLLILPR